MTDRPDQIDTTDDKPDQTPPGAEQPDNANTEADKVRNEVSFETIEVRFRSLVKDFRGKSETLVANVRKLLEGTNFELRTPDEENGIDINNIHKSQVCSKSQVVLDGKRKWVGLGFPGSRTRHNSGKKVVGLYYSDTKEGNQYVMDHTDHSHGYRMILPPDYEPPKFSAANLII